MDESYDPPERFATALDRLHELVAREVGSSDFGPGDYLPGLRVLLQSMDYDPHFSARGRRYAWGTVVGVLKGRAHAIRSMTENPGFDRHALGRPILITGLPRTGTTALHKLMGVDARFQGLQTWLLDAPMPRPPAASWSDYPAFHRTAAVLEARYRAAPTKRAAHHMAAEEVDECCLLLRQGFVSNLWTCGWSAATYDAWWQCQSEEASYRHYHRCLQLIGSNEPQQRWLLKNPGSVAHLDALFEVFPDACIIQTHRDPVQCVPSVCGVIHPARSFFHGREIDPRTLGPRERDLWAWSVERGEEVRRNHADRFIDIDFRAFRREPLREVQRIYAHFGLDLEPAAERSMRAWLAANPQHKHGKHEYTPEQYGVTADELRRHFAPYIARHGL